MLQHDLTLQQAQAQLCIDIPHLVPAPTDNGLLLIGQITVAFIAEEQAKLLFINELLTPLYYGAGQRYLPQRVLPGRG